MQILNSLAVIAGVISLVSAANFPLRVWRDPRNAISFNHHIELDPASGNAVINKTQGFAGFPNFIDQYGDLFGEISTGITYQGYFVPVPEATTSPTDPVHYQLRYGVRIPDVGGVLFTNFTTVGRGCGGNCGGIALDYGLDGERQYGEWYVIRESEGSPVWKVRWIALESNDAPLNLPAGALSVYNWAF